MNLKKKEEQYTASMLVTTSGYLVKVHKTVGSGLYRKICFFVDKRFGHRPWKLTIDRGMPLLDKEYYRLRDSGLQEVTLSDMQFVLAIVTAKLVMNDPYHGLEKGLKAEYLKKNTLAPLYSALRKVHKKVEVAEKPVTKAAPKNLVIAHIASQVKKLSKKVPAPNTSQKKIEPVENNLGANMEAKNPGIFEKLLRAASGN